MSAPQGWQGEADFALSAMYGLRCWHVTAGLRKIDRPGRAPSFELIQSSDVGVLTGIHYRMPYLQGVNVSLCGRNRAYDGWEDPEAWAPDHEAPDVSCACGTYAYLLPDAPGAAPPKNEYTKGADFYVQGVVEGTGHVIVGTKGFRCQKARIVALVLPVLTDKPSLASQYVAVAAELSAVVQYKYHEVPTFLSVHDALREFPLTPPEEAAS